MGTEKITLEEALALVETKQAEAKEAKNTLRAFMKENSLKEGDVPADEKLARKLVKLSEAYTKAQASVVKAKDAVKELKPKAERASIYEYPADMTAAEKKKFRARQRAEKKKAAKGDEPKAEKKEKKAKVEEPAATEPKKEKKEKKAKSDED